MPIWAAVLAGFLELLGMNKYFDHKYYKDDGKIFDCKGGSGAADADCSLGYIEFDDEGQAWSSTAADDLLRHVKGLVSKGHTTVVVYVHGWHDNASRKNGQRIAFQEKLQTLVAAINKDGYEKARHVLAPKVPEFERVFGIYVGWRGQSQWPKPVDYAATFWSRKAAAQRIGRGQLAEFLLRLHILCAKAQVASSADDAVKAISLIIVGHSFGGAALLATVSRPLEGALTAAYARAEAANPIPATDECAGENTLPVIEGLGDLVVLVNPAIEASLYRDIAELSGRHPPYRFSPCQLPLLMTVSAENDDVRKVWFGIGQGLATVARATHGKREHALRKALGVDDSQVTHCLEKTCPGLRHCALAPSPPIPPEPDLKHPGEIQLAATNYFRQASSMLYPLPGHDDGNNPFLVVRATKDVVNGHGGVFDPSFSEFLTQFVILEDIKKLSIKRGRSGEPSPSEPVRAVPLQ